MAKITVSSEVRARYAPPVLSPSVAVQGAATVQTYDSLESGEACYTPNRKLQPTYVVPGVSAVSSDGTLNVSNRVPDSVEWYVNGKTLASCGWTTSDYEVVTADRDGLTKGTLIVRRNISPGEVFELVPLMTYTDVRGRGSNNKIWGKPVRLRTTTRTLSAMVCRTDLPTTFTYNPALDVLEEYEYAAQVEGTETSAATLSALRAHPGAYLRTYPVRLIMGAQQLDPTLYTVRVDKVTGTALKAVTPATDGAIVSVTSEAVTVDARYVEDTARYRVTAVLKADTSKSKSFDIVVRRVRPTLTYGMINTTALDTSASTRTEELAVYYGSRRLPYPERIVDINWRGAVNTAEATEPTFRSMGSGAKISASLAALGVNTAIAGGKRVTGILWDIDCELKPALKKTTT